MTAPRTSFGIPADNRIVLPDGTMNQAWLEWADRVGRALEAFRVSADGMDDLTSGSTTLDETVTAWEEFRASLQEIV